MISSPSGSPMILVFWRKISSPNSKGFPRAGPQTRVGVGKFSDFLALSVNILKTVADTAKVTIPWVLSRRAALTASVRLSVCYSCPPVSCQNDHQIIDRRQSRQMSTAVADALSVSDGRRCYSMICRPSVFKRRICQRTFQAIDYAVCLTWRRRRSRCKSNSSRFYSAQLTQIQ